MEPESRNGRLSDWIEREGGGRVYKGKGVEIWHLMQCLTRSKVDSMQRDLAAKVAIFSVLLSLVETYRALAKVECQHLAS